MDNLEIRPLEKSDIEYVINIENICFVDPWSRNIFEEEIESNKTLYYSSYLGDTMVGYVGLRQIFDEGHIMNIAVLPEYRGKGISEKMLFKIFEDADKNIKSYTLEVRASNIAAQKLYEKFEFKSVGIRKGYYGNNGEDAVIMWRE